MPLRRQRSEGWQACHLLIDAGGAFADSHWPSDGGAYICLGAWNLGGSVRLRLPIARLSTAAACSTHMCGVDAWRAWRSMHDARERRARDAQKPARGKGRAITWPRCVRDRALEAILGSVRMTHSVASDAFLLFCTTPLLGAVKVQPRDCLDELSASRFPQLALRYQGLSRYLNRLHFSITRKRPLGLVGTSSSAVARSLSTRASMTSPISKGMWTAKIANSLTLVIGREATVWAATSLHYPKPPLLRRSILLRKHRASYGHGVNRY